MTRIRCFTPIMIHAQFIASLGYCVTWAALKVQFGINGSYWLDGLVAWPTLVLSALGSVTHLRIIHYDPPRQTVLVLLFAGALFWGFLFGLTAGPNVAYYCEQIENACLLTKTCIGFGSTTFILIFLRASCMTVVYSLDIVLKAHTHRLDQEARFSLPLIARPRSKPPALEDVNSAAAVANISGGLEPDKHCMQCQLAPSIPEGIFCGEDCIALSKRNAPKLLALSPLNHMYHKISDLFNHTWLDPAGTRPVLKRIFAVISTKENDRSHKIYREGLEIRRGAQTTALGNQRKMWHGTHRECGIGEPKHEALCRSASCAMCCAISSSLDTNRLRGPGSVSVHAMASKAHQYSRNATGSKWAALLLTSVMTDNSYRVSTEEPELVLPPNGYDLILRQSETELDEEAVVYRSEAIQPAFLVLYLVPPDSPK